MHRMIVRPYRAAADRVRDLVADVQDLAHDRSLLLLRGDTGAQAAEYAMLGGVSAAACGGIVIVFQTSDVLGGLIGTVVDTLGSVLSGWFS